MFLILYVCMTCLVGRTPHASPLTPPHHVQTQEEAAAKEGKAQALQEDVHLLLREKEALRQKAEALASKLVRACVYACVWMDDAYYV